MFLFKLFANFVEINIILNVDRKSRGVVIYHYK